MNEVKFVVMGPKAKDITGQRFGRLIALGPVGHNRWMRLLWLCQCDCGNTTTPHGESLRSGVTQSCGCLRTEMLEQSEKRHGESGTRLYHVWDTMIQRCTNPNSTKYKDYGARGIGVCDEWRASYMAFKNHVSSLIHYNEKGYSLDRINNNGNYEPGNIKWSTAKEQRSNRRDTRRIQ